VIILDTNILSAVMQLKPALTVLDWLDRQPAESIWITAITLFEAKFGLASLPKGKRRLALEEAFASLLQDDLDNRVLDFDSAAALVAAELAADRRKAGKPVDIRDTQIAGIAISRRALFATRNVKHFSDLTVPVINPWE
jgi:toxin FitB